MVSPSNTAVIAIDLVFAFTYPAQAQMAAETDKKGVAPFDDGLEEVLVPEMMSEAAKLELGFF
ncbi:MAG: hypothetical protein IFK92_01735 [Acidobacteria bacterium]|nr:hypothetical protein [Candidatus Sulfomarinibacter kjeldsenii]